MKIKIIDLTHVLNENIPVYPGTPAPKFEKMAAIEPDGFRETVMHISSHVGTHIDAPAHFLERGATMPEYSLADFQGSAVVVQVDPGCTQITSQMIENTRGVEEADVILFATGWDRNWTDQKRYHTNYPTPTPEAIDLILTLHPQIVGFDTPGIDPVDSSDYRGHKRLLEADILMVENLRGLDSLPSSGFWFMAAPLVWDDADGAPVRAFAMVMV